MLAGMPVTSASYSFTMRLRIERQGRAFAQVAAAIADAGGDVGAIDIVRSDKSAVWRDVTVAASSTDHARGVVEAVGNLDHVSVEAVSDRTFLMHLGGKLEVKPSVPLATRDDLSMAYTPGVGRVCEAIAADPEKAWALTIKRNTVAVVSDGSAVLGLGDIGPEAAMPVMEGKAALFRRFAGIDAWPICLDTHDVDQIVDIVAALAPGFGGINLEDISAPRCFEVEERLRERLSIPVFHDDQHGTAVVVLAALLNALRVTGQNIADVRVVVLGVGAAGIAVSRMLHEAGARNLVGVDRQGILCRSRLDGLDDARRRFAELTNPEDLTGSLDDALEGADVFIGLSGPGAVTAAQLERMADDSIVFAMANPVPEILPSEVPDSVRIMATGRSDFPNQINNVLCFPGLFRGALDVQATDVTPGMKLAAAHALAGVISDDELAEDYIIPSVFNRRVVDAIAPAVSRAAIADGVARRDQRTDDGLTAPGAAGA